MWIKILIGVAVVIVLLVIVIATRPSTFHVERSITIETASSDRVANMDAFACAALELLLEAL